MAGGLFGVVDGLVFGASVALSLLVGVYYALTAGPPSGENDFFVGSRRMPVLPSMLSLLTSFMSGLALLTSAPEFYLRGAGYWLHNSLGTCLSLVVGAVFFVPVIYRLKSASIYEFFTQRFGSPLLHKLMSLTFVTVSLLYMGLVVYGTALALAAVSRVQPSVLLALLGAVCTFYTAIGGLRAVVYTDTLQAVFMYGGVFALIAKGSADAGGVATVFRISSEGGRLDALTNFDANPLQYISVPISLLGSAVSQLGAFTMSQVAMQRYASMPTLNRARLLAALLIPASLVLIGMCHYVGMLVYARYRHCDPMERGVVQRDQLTMLYVVETLGGVPGLPGLFLAALVSATLSTASSVINSVAAVVWEDFLRAPLQPRLSARGRARALRLLTAASGAVGVALGFLCEPVGGLLMLLVSIVHCVVGPGVGVFALGVFSRGANGRGALVGLLVATPIVWALNLGNLLARPYDAYRLPTETVCSLNSTLLNSTVHLGVFGDESVPAPFRISTYLYPLIGASLSFCIGWVVSLLTNRFCPEASRHGAPTTLAIVDADDSCKNRLLRQECFDIAVEDSKT